MIRNLNELSKTINREDTDPQLRKYFYLVETSFDKEEDIKIHKVELKSISLNNQSRKNYVDNSKTIKKKDKHIKTYATLTFYQNSDLNDCIYIQEEIIYNEPARWYVNNSTYFESDEFADYHIKDDFSTPRKFWDIFMSRTLIPESKSKWFNGSHEYMLDTSIAGAVLQLRMYMYKRYVNEYDELMRLKSSKMYDNYKEQAYKVSKIKTSYDRQVTWFENNVVSDHLYYAICGNENGIKVCEEYFNFLYKDVLFDEKGKAYVTCPKCGGKVYVSSENAGMRNILSNDDMEHKDDKKEQPSVPPIAPPVKPSDDSDSDSDFTPGDNMGKNDDDKPQTPIPPIAPPIKPIV